MTKMELVDKIANDAGITKTAAAAALQAFTGAILETLKKKDGKVALIGFGSFVTAKREKRKGRNPQTGKKITIKARRVVKFRPGKRLRDAVKDTNG